MAIGLLFVEHGLATWFGIFTGRPDRNFPALHAFAGPIETIGGVLLIVGLFTRSTAFILCGEMAVAYFQSRLRWETPGVVLFPTRNNGEEAVLNCFFFLWLVTRGGGAWSLDALIARSRTHSAPDPAISAAAAPQTARS
jgi:putative oxidoreductase